MKYVCFKGYRQHKCAPLNKTSHLLCVTNNTFDLDSSLKICSSSFLLIDWNWEDLFLSHWLMLLWFHWVTLTFPRLQGLDWNLKTCSYAKAHWVCSWTTSNACVLCVHSHCAKDWEPLRRQGLYPSWYLTACFNFSRLLINIYRGN
jgi:hypothetical protein